MAHVARSRSVKVSVTPAEYAVIRLAAHVKSMSVDDYLHELVLPQSRIDAGKSNEIIDNLTRELTMSSQPSGTVLQREPAFD